MVSEVSKSEGSWWVPLAMAPKSVLMFSDNSSGLGGCGLW